MASILEKVPRKCGGCDRFLPSYDSHELCIACLPLDHDSVTCQICTSFPDELQATRRQAFIYRNQNPNQCPPEGWSVVLFTKFTTLDSPLNQSDAEEDPEGIEEEGDGEALVVEEGPHPDLMTPEEQHRFLKDEAFRQFLLKFRSDESLSLPTLVTPLGATPPSGHSSTRRVSGSSLKRRTAETEVPAPEPKRSRVPVEQEEDDDLTILKVTHPPPSMENRMGNLERLMASLAQNVKDFTSKGNSQGTSSAGLSRQRIPQRRPFDFAHQDLSGEDSDGAASTASRLTTTTAEKLRVGEKRILWLDSLREVNPELSHPAATASGPASAHFGGRFAPRSQSG